MPERPTVPLVVLFLGVVAVSWSAIFVREAAAPALVIGMYRMVVAGAPVALLAAVEQRRSPAPLDRAVVWPLVLSAACLAAHFGFWIESLNRTSVAASVVLVAAQPLYVAIIAPLFLREPVERRVWFAIGIGAVGAFIMAGEDLREGAGTVTGDLFAVLGGVTGAVYFILGRRVRPQVSWMRYVGIVYPLTAVMLVACVLVAGHAFTGYSAKTYTMIALAALVPQLLGHTAINWSLAFLSAVIVSMMILLEPLITTLLAIPILDELPTPFELAGGALIIGAVYLAVRPRPEERLPLEISAAD
jgi:drug/metabolite transporter (DMT)-like permease